MIVLLCVLFIAVVLQWCFIFSYIRITEKSDKKIQNHLKNIYDFFNEKDLWADFHDYKEKNGLH
jgi:hypothetical protein